MGLARGTGFLARFLLAWPQSTQGSRLYSEPPEKWPFLDTFNQRLAEILNVPTPFDEAGTLSPMVLSLTPDAKAAWVEFHDGIEVKLTAGGELHGVRDVASKIADNAVRLAALFHMMCSNNSSSSIEFDHIVSGCRIAAWHLNEARRFFGERTVPAELSAAARLDAWLLEECRQQRTHRITRSVLQYGPGRLREKKILDAALHELIDHRRVRVTQDGRSKIIHVNPRLLSGGNE
jgi:putative DNA primase/helicase